MLVPVFQHPLLHLLQEPVWVAGRIVAEWETSGALNEQSVLLEGSREGADGIGRVNRRGASKDMLSEVLRG